MEQVKEKVKSTLDSKWKETKWTVFIEIVSKWLVVDKNEDEDDVVEALVGLISYGATTEEKLQNVADDKKGFADRLSPKGVPDAICDLLFEQYVAKSRRKSGDSDTYVGVRELFSHVNDDFTHKLDGINLKAPYIPRLGRVLELIHLVESNGPYVVVCAPPASGKTSLLALTGAYLEEEKKARVVYYAVNKAFSLKDLSDDFDEVTGIDDVQNQGHWILIDDAQNAYKKEFEQFWQSVVKHPRISHPHMVIATTYDLHTGDSPVALCAAPRFQSLAFSVAEFDELFNSVSRAGKDDEFYFAKWHKYKTHLIDLSSGHVGVFIQGIRMLQLVLIDTPKGVGVACEEDAISMLHSGYYFNLLKRCFPPRENLEEGQHECVLDALLGSRTRVEDGSRVAAELVRLKRCGVLSHDGSFTSRAAASYYINMLFPGRPAVLVAETLDEVVIETVKSMSSARFRAAQDKGVFPKEAVFQQMFFLGLGAQIPPNYTIIPEKNTFIPDDSGDEVLSGELDFYINGELQWAIELVREGKKIGEHLDRFHAEKGKYRYVEPNEYLVIDCRPGPLSQVRKDKSRCTLFFSGDFTTCECVMREKVPLTIQLKD